jgi:hypothetical protein
VVVVLILQDCIGAIGVTHIQASASKNTETALCAKKSFPSQNVLAAIDFDLRFTYVLAGWEGSAHGDAVLVDATERENGLHVPHGNKICSTMISPYRVITTT